MIVARILGIIGLLLTTYAIFIKKEKTQDIYFAVGGVGLLIYSLSLRDPVFILLQIIFIGASLWELRSLSK